MQNRMVSILFLFNFHEVIFQNFLLELFSLAKIALFLFQLYCALKIH